ncbi:MAG: penicillin-binding protein transpeptidase [Acidimicrobiales bacterium]|nr:penicillin-binding protein transpeptidase [Acidimicrobiales bacterium]
MTKGRGAVIGGVVIVVALVAAVVWFGRSAGDGSDGSKPEGPAADLARRAADEFAAAWQAGDLSKVAFTADEPVASKAIVAQFDLAVAALTPAPNEHPAKVEILRFAHEPDRVLGGGSGADGHAVGEAVAAARVTWKLDATRTWTYDTDITVQRGTRSSADDTWRIAFTPKLIEPSLAAKETLRSVRVRPARGDILGLDGQPLVGMRDVVEIGIQPSRTPDPEGTARTVAAIVKVDPGALVLRVKAAKPDQFVSVVTLRREAYDAIRDQVQPLPGTVFHEAKQPLAPSKDFARALLGTVGPATKEIVDGSAGRVADGDQTGLSGLQRAQDAKLAGTTGLTVQVVPVGPGKAPRTIKAFPAVAGQPMTVTLDARVQVAADQVMATAPKPAALVAIRISTGDVLAVSNGPSSASGYNRAMIGHYPPGSTFKVASGLTLLEHGVTPDTPVNCPPTFTVGKVFKNAEGEVLGTVPFRTDFAKSCNTAFVGQSKTITAQQLTDTAGLLGYRKLDLGVPVFGGSVPVTADATEHAANMIGQGKVEGSPLTVALASASVASGRSLQPRIIVDPAKPQPIVGPALPPAQILQLKELMRGVVTGGTGTALAGVPGGEVSGKTGTAEFGNASPPQTHAWFTGFQGDIAFAVLVEDGGFGGAVAAPLAAQFLTKLATP